MSKIVACSTLVFVISQIAGNEVWRAGRFEVRRRARRRRDFCRPLIRGFEHREDPYRLAHAICAEKTLRTVPLEGATNRGGSGSGASYAASKCRQNRRGQRHVVSSRQG
jgi:hypothetical protein